MIVMGVRTRGESTRRTPFAKSNSKIPNTLTPLKKNLKLGAELKPRAQVHIIFQTGGKSSHQKQNKSRSRHHFPY